MLHVTHPTTDWSRVRVSVRRALGLALALTMLATACGDSDGDGSAALPPGACAVPDRGLGTYVEDGWYYCPGEENGAASNIIKQCVDGELRFGGACVCLIADQRTLCVNRTLSDGTFAGEIECSDGVDQCGTCGPSGCL